MRGTWVRGTNERASPWRVRGSIRMRGTTDARKTQMRGHTDARQHTRMRGTIADSDVNAAATNETTRSAAIHKKYTFVTDGTDVTLLFLFLPFGVADIQ